jgi:hypothetical protein
MSAALMNPGDCCTPECADEILTQVPGATGAAGADGADGADGSNAFTTLGANYTMPAELGSATVAVADSSWIGLNQILYLAGAGYLQATAIPDATSVTLKNLEDAATDAYLTNVAPATVIPSGSKLSPGGLQGPSAAAAGAELLVANNLSDVASLATTQSNLGLATMAFQAASAVAITGGSVGVLTNIAVAATIRSDLGLVIGTNVQAFDAELAAIAGLTSAADKLPYFTGAGTAAVADITAAGRALIDDATAAAQRQTLSVLPKQGLLGSLIGADFNSTSDQAITIASGITKYVIRRIVVVNASISLTTASGGVYGAAAKSAPNIVANTQVYSALTAAAKFIDLTLTALCGTDVFTQAALYFSLSVAQGSAATGDCFVYGDVVE